MLRIWVSFCLWILSAAGQPVPAVPSQLDRVAAGYARERGFMGAVLVAQGGQIVFEKGYGMANLEWDIPNTPETKFRLGSITKQFTATAILQLAEQEKLKLEDTLDKYLPDCPEAWKTVTIHQLLNHTSGIPSYTDMPEFRAPKLQRIPLNPVEIAMLTKEQKLNFQPGEGFRYNNTGYVLLGHIIEKASGGKYDAWLRSGIFDPLEMKDSGYDWTAPLLRRRAAGYRYNAGAKTYENAGYLDMSLPHAAGSLYSTARDLYRWDRGLKAGKLLQAASFEKMITPGRNNYAYGWMVPKAVRAVQEHGGGINGYSTMIRRFPAEDAVVIVLSNVENGNAGGVAVALSSVLFGARVELPWERKEISVDPKLLDRYTGTYTLPIGPQLTVSVEKGRLMLSPAGQPKAEAFAETETRFFLKVVDATLEFVAGADGQFGEIVLRQGGQEFRGKRVVP